MLSSPGTLLTSLVGPTCGDKHHEARVLAAPGGVCNFACDGAQQIGGKVLPNWWYMSLALSTYSMHQEPFRPLGGSSARLSTCHLSSTSTDCTVPSTVWSQLVEVGQQFKGVGYLGDSPSLRPRP